MVPVTAAVNFAAVYPGLQNPLPVQPALFDP
jgi:hypothetical protein